MEQEENWQLGIIRIFGILRIYGIFTKREKKDRNNENIWNFHNIEIFI